ncbi:MAG: DUF4430 domain-containing protein [Candidatus Pacebacteria bacterium]|nr:DUF4430 domain-containing protein [Candidatus Paceibacterota bacterium]
MKKQYIYGFLIIILLVAGYLISVNRNNTPADSQVETTTQEQLQQVKQATLIAGETTTTLTFTEGQTLYDALIKAQQAGLTLELKEYPGMGYFVAKIGSLVPTADRYLMYSVNGEEASEGISSYVLKENDIVKWEVK